MVAKTMLTYLITKDLVETLERKFRFNLTSKLKRGLKKLENEFILDLLCLLPRSNNVSMETSGVSKQLELLVKRSGLPIVSLDRVYVTNADQYLEVTRMTDQKTGEVKITERPGELNLPDQVSRLKSYNEIVLADVGAFEGETLSEVCELIESQGIRISEICLGFAGRQGYEKINKKRKVTSLNLFNFYEWIELRDFLGIDGRNFGVSKEGRIFAPYWENLCGWASISRTNRKKVEQVCRSYNCQVIGRLWQEGYDVSKIGKPTKFGGKK